MVLKTLRLKMTIKLLLVQKIKIRPKLKWKATLMSRKKTETRKILLVKRRAERRKREQGTVAGPGEEAGQGQSHNLAEKRDLERGQGHTVTAATLPDLDPIRVIVPIPRHTRGPVIRAIPTPVIHRMIHHREEVGVDRDRGIETSHHREIGEGEGLGHGGEAEIEEGTEIEVETEEEVNPAGVVATGKLPDRGSHRQELHEEEEVGVPVAVPLAVEVDTELRQGHRMRTAITLPIPRCTEEFRLL